MQLPEILPVIPPFDILNGKDAVMPNALRLSVILPFHDPRGHPEHLKGWTKDQTLAAEAFQIVAVTSILDAELLRKIRMHLRPHDLLVHAAAEDHFALYAVGAAAAQARVLFFSEDHCTADPGCLQGVAEYFSSPESEAATVRWGDINESDVGFMEQLLCQAAAATWFLPGVWNKLRIRGFAIRGDIYRRTGGFEVDRHGFSELLMAAKLDVLGVTIRHLKDAGVHHINTETVAQMRHSSSTYALGECSYCDEQASEFSEAYFKPPMVLLMTTHVPPRIAWWMAAAIGQALDHAGEPSPELAASHARARRHAMRLRSSAVFAPLRTLGAELWAAAALLRYKFWRFSVKRRLRAFGEFWERVAHATRVRYVARHGAGFLERHAVKGLSAEASGIHGAYGLYPLELQDGISFRWTSPAAVIPFAIAADDYEVTIQVAPFRGSPRHFTTRFFWNKHLLPGDRVRVKAKTITLKVKHRECNADGPQSLGIITVPLKPTAAESRLISLPLCSVHIRPLHKGGVGERASREQPARS